MHLKNVVGILLILNAIPLFAGPLEETVKAFERRPEYVRPFATIVGSLTNSGWYQSASIGKDFSFGVSLPVSIMYLNKKDREFSGSYSDAGCATCREQEAVSPAIDCRECIECQEFTAPTIFGTAEPPEVFQYMLREDGSVVQAASVEPRYSSGVEELGSIAGLPFASLQAALSLYYTTLIVRYIGVPEIADDGLSIHFPGFGLQHDFHHFLPALPIALSLAAHFTIVSAAWTPGNDIEGTLKLNGMSNFLGVLAGYQPSKWFEIFCEAGWEHSFLKPSGTMTVDNEMVAPTLTLTGRNGFRASLNFAFPITFNPVAGGVAGSQFGYFVNLISFKSKKKE